MSGGARGAPLRRRSVFSILLAAGMVAWAALISWETYLSGKVVADVSSPAIFPTIISLLLVGLAAASVLNALGSRAGSDTETSAGLLPGARLRVLGVLACLVLYAAVMPSLGFYIATPIAIVAMAWLSGMRRPIPLFLLAIAFIALLYAFFSLLLRVPLPPGITYGWRLWP